MPASISEADDGQGTVETRRPNDSGPSLPDGPPSLRRDSRLSGRVWSDTFASDEGNDSVVAPAAGAAVSDADTPVVRAGPAMLAADSWSVPPVPNSGVDFYLGSRRAGPRPPRVWLALAVALVGLSAFR